MKARLRMLLGSVLTTCLVITPAAMPPAHAGDSARYVSGGTVVVRSGGVPVADEGSVVCNDGNGVGVGGFCVGFGGGDAVHVVDEVAGENVPFSACIDNSGDGICTSPDFGPCADFVAFSHDDDGSFANPVGPLPTGFTPGCGGGLAFNGYVVFLCEGAHAGGLAPHAHASTSGTGTVTTGGEGSGGFCGGSEIAQSRKPYVSDRLVAPPGGGGSGYRGGCTASLARDVSGILGGQNTTSGTVAVVVAATDAGGTLDPLAPVTDVSCELFVNGAAGGTVLNAADGFGITSAAGPLNVAAEPGDVLSLCTAATVRTTQFYECADIAVFEPLPEPVLDLLAELNDTAAGALNQLDPTTCALLSSLAGTYGPVVVQSDGDVYVNGDLVYDCPPYGA